MGPYGALFLVASRSGATSELDVHVPHPTGLNGCDSRIGSSDSAPEGPGGAEDEPARDGAGATASPTTPLPKLVRLVAVARRLGGVDIIDVKTTTQQSADRAAIVLGPVLAIAVAWASATVRGDMSIANAALALAFVCVAAALVSPLAGFVTSAVAALR